MDGCVLWTTWQARYFRPLDQDDALRALAALISAGVLAKPTTPGAFPLLPARYHLAASGIDGVALRLSATDPEHWDQFKLSRTGTHIEESPAYRLLVCRNCGEPYVEAWDDGRSLNPRPDMVQTATRRVLRLTAAGAKATELEDDDAASDSDPEQPIDFDPVSGEIADGPGDGVLSLEPAEMRQDEEERRAYVRRCLSCGQGGGRYR